MSTAFAHTIGEKFHDTAGLDVADIAKLVRADIKAAVKAGEIPDVKYGVRIERFSGGTAIRVNTTIPGPDGVPSTDPRSVAYQRDGGMTYGRTYTVEMSALSDKLQGIVDAYNFDDSDSMTDYFHVRFYSSVNIEGTER